MIDLAAPLALLLAPFPFLTWVLPRLGGGGGGLWVPVELPSSKAPRGREMVAVWLLLTLALAGPRWLSPTPALEVTGRDLAIALDLSGSMVRDDFELDGQPVTRLEAVQRVGAAFARGRGGDRIALIFFGSNAYYAAPFTYDVEAVAKRIEGATIGISGRATNISDALGLALKRFETSNAETRVVILLSDGANNAGEAHPLAVAELAAAKGVRVHTIAMAPTDLEEDPGGRGAVDAKTLASIAKTSGGTFHRVRTTEDLARVTAELDALETTDGAGLAAEVFLPLWLLPAAGAVALLVWSGWRNQA